MTSKIKLIVFASVALLTGCKEAEIEGVWYGSDKNFNSGIIMSLFDEVKEELAGEQIIISNLKTEGGSNTFLVTLGEKKHSKEWVEEILEKIEKRRKDNKTTITLSFTDVGAGKDENEKTLLSVLKELNMEQTGSITSEIKWEDAKVIVYTQQLSIMGHTDPYSKFNPMVYCELKVPLTNELSGLTIDAPLPDITPADIPEGIRHSMTDKQTIDYIKEKNELRRYVNIGMQIHGNIYPNKATFSDAFMNELSQDNGIYNSNRLSYSLDYGNIHIAYGSIPDTNFDPVYGAMLGDVSGKLHRKCDDMIKKITPALDKKRADALKFTNVGKMELNPEWKPEN